MPQMKPARRRWGQSSDRDVGLCIRHRFLTHRAILVLRREVRLVHALTIGSNRINEASSAVLSLR